jgi:cysteine desulfurase
MTRKVPGAGLVLNRSDANAKDGHQPRRVYLDNHATTPVDPRVRAVVVDHLERTFGNASSADHVFGDEAECAVEAAADEVAALVGASADDVLFTAGATESINLALQGFARWAARRLGRPPRVAVSAVEHRAVLDTARVLEDDGRIKLSVLPVDSCARLDLDHFRRVADAGLDLVCVMAANNEVGTLYPLSTVGAIARQVGAAFLCDGTQAIGKVHIDVAEDGVTFLALSGHKLYGPKGVGALVCAPGAPLDPILFGGGQQRRLRPGTINAPGIAGLGEACRLRRLEMGSDEARVGALRDELQAALRRALPSLVVNGDIDARLAGNLHIAIPGVPNQAVVARLRDRVALATGAACSSGIEGPSHVLRAMGLPRNVQDGALRIGLGKFTTDEDIRTAAAAIIAAVDQVAQAIASGPAGSRHP